MTHKWLMAFIGLQFLIWAITGVYMVTVDIHYIHGESLVKNQQQKLELNKAVYPINSLVADYPEAKNISLVSIIDRQAFIFTNGEQGKVAIDAVTGTKLPDMSEKSAKQIARYYYADNDKIIATKLISSAVDKPDELSARHLPVWQVTFDNFAKPTLYINQYTGQIVTKRHNYWRLFDWMWRFHIMDYDDGENVANWFLFLIVSLGILAALVGAVLTYFRVFRSTERGAA